MEIMFFCLGIGCFILCLSLSYKIFSEAKIKKITFHKSLEEVINSTPGKNHQSTSEHMTDDLMKRLDEFRMAKFARKMPTVNKNNHGRE